MAVLPLIFQDPAVSGETLGSGVLADSGAEKPTVMGLVPLTVPAPERGVNEATSIAGAGVTGFGVALAPDVPLCRDAATDVVRTVVWPGADGQHDQARDEHQHRRDTGDHQRPSRARATGSPL